MGGPGGPSQMFATQFGGWCETFESGISAKRMYPCVENVGVDQLPPYLSMISCSAVC